MRQKNLKYLPADKYISLVLEAQNLLIRNPYDLAHGVGHHCRVSDFSISLIIREKLEVDWRTVSLASWWHDIGDKKGQNHIFLTNALEKQGVDSDIETIIIKAVEEHSFSSQNHSSLESKILFDADKSEYINPSRLLYFSELVRSNMVSQDKAVKYKKLWFNRMKTLEKRIFFDYTKSFYKKYKKEAFNIMNRLRVNYEES